MTEGRSFWCGKKGHTVNRCPDNQTVNTYNSDSVPYNMEERRVTLAHIIWGQRTELRCVPWLILYWPWHLSSSIRNGTVIFIFRAHGPQLTHDLWGMNFLWAHPYCMSHGTHLSSVRWPHIIWAIVTLRSSMSYGTGILSRLEVSARIECSI